MRVVSSHPAARCLMRVSPGARRGSARDRVRWARRAAGLAALVLVAAVLLNVRRSSAARPAGAALVTERFAREAGRHRLTGPRLSVSRAHAPCPARVPPGGTIPRATCPAPRSAPSLSRDLLSPAPLDADPLDPARYAAALVDVLWADDRGVSLDRAVAFLESAARLADRPAGVLADILADLSGAYLARAEVRQRPEDLFRALDAAARAAALEPDNATACYNQALALEHAGADGGAARAWARCAALDGGSGWGIEARRRAGERAAAAADRTRGGPPPPDATPAEVDAFARAEPGTARVYGWGEALGAWGEAVLRGDTAAGARALARADAVGRALARRGGDASLADAVAAIRASAPADRPRLARAHASYARGLRTYEEVDHAAPRPALDGLLALRPLPDPLRGWTRRFEGLVLMAEGRDGAAEARLAAAAGEADTLRHPALAASLYQTLGTVRFRDGRYEPAWEAWGTARRLFHRAGEPENAGGTRYLEADAEFSLGAPEAHGTLHRAVVELRGFRRSRWLHTSLAVLAMELADEGLPHAALAMYDEGLAVARGTGRPIYEAEARLLRAQLLVAMDRRGAAEADIAAGEPIVRSLPEGERRDWFQADLHAARAVLLLRDAPGRAAAQMDSLLAVPGGARTEPRILLGLLGRARARLAAGDAEAAAADLDTATGMLTEQGRAVTTALLRSSILDAARATFDQLVMLRLARGDTVGALRALERGRLSVAPGPDAPRGEGWALPPGTAALDYALVGDTLLAWIVTPDGTVLHRRTLDRAVLLRTVERLRALLERGAPEAQLRPLLASLYDDLVRPLRPALPRGTRLAVVADGELADIPFAALHDREEDRYLVEDHTPVTASSLRDVRGRTVRPARPAGPALFVADPAFDRRAYPGLPPLPGARAEVAAVAPLYGDTQVLGGGRATVDTVAARLRGASVFHFAGHGVFDDERPARSFLLLAPSPDDPGGGRLTATALGEMDLRDLRLVVLSSCETLRSPGGRSGGFAGLSGALLGAGAGGVVGSPWRVRDDLSRTLMRDFHDAYGRTGDGAASLRAAQLRALRSTDPALRTPATWAAFRYAGQ